jgi:hypothetical protein
LLVVLGIKPKTFHMLGMYSAMKLHPQPSNQHFLTQDYLHNFLQKAGVLKFLVIEDNEE